MKFFILALCLVHSAFALEVTPTELVNQSLSFQDDANFKNLNTAIERQLKAYARGLSGQIKFGNKVYSKTVLKDSLMLLQTLAADAANCVGENCLAEFNRQVNAKFTIYRPKPNKTEPGYRKAITTKFTSYYSPDFHGSRVKTEKYPRPIYKKPENVADQNYTRVEIDYKGALDGKNAELFYVSESYYDLYLLHVQGGGRITIENGDGSTEQKYLSYNGKNSRSFQMIYKYMIQQGYLTSDRAGISYQRSYLANHPEKEEEIFSSCPSYVYFKESEEEPVGLNNIPLTEGRSLALDSTIYKTTGLINFVKTIRATSVDEAGNVTKTPFSRFFIAQDTGGAIRGNARCDLYFGYGPEAELTAYNMNEMGEQYFLVKK